MVRWKISERSCHRHFNCGAFQKNPCLFPLSKEKMGNSHMLCFAVPLNMVVNDFSYSFYGRTS